YLGVAHCVGCGHGTDALWLSLMAARVEPGDEVATTPFTFFATFSAIARAGARPLPVDIDPATFNIDIAQLRRRIEQYPSRKLRVVMPVHLYGQCADMDALASLASEHKLRVLEDAAQAAGAAWRGKRAGTLSSMAAFSFYPTKNLSAFGDAGCVTTDDDALAAELRVLRNHGSRQRYHHDEIGWNSRLDSIQAAVLRVKLRHLEDWNTRRRRNATRYDQLFTAAGLAGAGLDNSPIVLPHSRGEAQHIYHQYVVRARRRDELRRYLAERGIGSEVYYPVPLHMQPCFAYLGYRAGDFPQSERAAAEVLALPIFPELTPDEQQYVVETVAEFY